MVVVRVHVEAARGEAIQGERRGVPKEHASVSQTHGLEWQAVVKESLEWMLVVSTVHHWISCTSIITIYAAFMLYLLRYN